MTWYYVSTEENEISNICRTGIIIHSVCAKSSKPI
jgi:hypothetical protein